MEFDKLKNVANKLGFEANVKAELNGDVLYISLSSSIPAKEDIKSILLEIKEGFDIYFFDCFHRQISDPGAYITAFRKGNGFMYEKGNHGWSGGPYRIDIGDLADYIIKNWSYGDPNEVFKNHIKIRIWKRHKNSF